MCILVQFIATTHVAFFVVYVYIYSMLYSSTINCILYGRTMRLVQQLITLFASLLLLLLLLLIVIYDSVGTYDETIIMNWYVGQWWWIMSTYLLNLLSCPYPSTPPRIITTLLFQAYTYSWVMLLIVLYDGAVLVRMTWYTDDSVMTAISIVCRVRWIMYCPMGTIEMIIIPLYLPLLSRILLLL